MSEIVRTIPAQLVRAPAGYFLYERITVTNAAATLASLLSGGSLPKIPVPNNPNIFFAIKFVDLQSETDPASIVVRYTDDGQTVPTATLGFVVPSQPAFLRIPADAQDIRLISAGANVNIQVKLGIVGTSTGDN